MMFEIQKVIASHIWLQRAHIHTDGTQYEYVWALAFYEKRHEVTLIQLILWNDISHLKMACMKPKSTCPYM